MSQNEDIPGKDTRHKKGHAEYTKNQKIFLLERRKFQEVGKRVKLL